MASCPLDFRPFRHCSWPNVGACRLPGGCLLGCTGCTLTISIRSGRIESAFLPSFTPPTPSTLIWAATSRPRVNLAAPNNCEPTNAYLLTMNRFALPPTRGSSIEFKDQDGNEKIDSLCTTFELLPPALHDPVQFHTTSASSYSPPLPPLYPMSAVETVRARRRLTAASAAAARASQSQDGGVTLPPPPTRTRKIINIKVPKGVAVEPSGTTASKGKATAKGGKGAHVEANGASKHTSRAPEGQREGNEKQPSALSAAGRKMSRRTAHTIIERRRRCRMNEEFAKLKGMIPACTGDMHKLSILQVSHLILLLACPAC